MATLSRLREHLGGDPIPQVQFPAYAFARRLKRAPRADPVPEEQRREEIFMRNRVTTSLAVCAALTIATGAWAQQPTPAAPPPAPAPAYGTPGVTLEQAKKAVEAAEAEAKKNGWRMAIAVVSIGGYLIHFSRMDDTQFASNEIAQHKARAAAMFRRPTKAFQDALAANPPNLFVLTLDGVIASDGGLPIMSGGKVIGAMGCSGGLGAQDAQVCKAGVDTIK
jgi:glc operon protein GlcG